MGARFNHGSAAHAARVRVGALRRERLFVALASTFRDVPAVASVGKIASAELAARERALLRFLRAPYEPGSLREIANESDRRLVLCAGLSKIPGGAPATPTGFPAASNTAPLRQYGFATA